MASPDRSALIERIRKLSRMTVAAGATEAEAASAAALLAKLMADHSVGWDELKLKAAAGECLSDHVSSFNPRFDDWMQLGGGIAKLFEVKCWLDRSTEDLLGLGFAQQSCKIIYFGLPEDVAAAVAMTQIVAAAVHVEAGAFATGLPRGTKSAEAERKIKSFRAGMIARLGARIVELTRAARAVRPTGQALVVLKDQLVSAEFAKLGLSLGTWSPRRSALDSDAYAKGRAAGDRANLRPSHGIAPDGRRLRHG
jgi:hypothetical protein